MIEISLPNGFRHHLLEICASTNTECLAFARDGDPGNLWVTSRCQTAGKGSRGRNWVSEEGNLYASLLLVDPCDVQHLAGLTFVAAVALRNALSKLVTKQEIAHKWPNDVLIDQKKCSGILLESSLSSHRSAVVIGIGVNCRHHPAETRFPATSLAQLGFEVSPDEMFSLLALSMAEELGIWDQGRNFDMVLKAWLNHAWGIGKRVEVGLHDGATLTGTFERLTEFGQMVLSQQGGQETIISVGDIFGINSD